MRSNLIFHSHIYGESFLGLNNNHLQKIIETINLMKKGDIKGESNSNFNFGWQSKPLPHDGLFEILTQKICQSAYDLCKSLDDFNFTRINMLALWANINYHGDVNWHHKHSGDLSGVYYLNTYKDCGDLLLDSFQFSANSKIHTYLRRISRRIIEPKNDKCIIFDAECVHAVLKNRSDKPRISVSFNLGIND
tara:strand:- start:67 stop:642 length:576 start_codon:yes stop_codon:yes gene_type:complete